MKQASRFNVPSAWKPMLTEMQVDPQAVLIYAGLPADLFNRHGSTLSPVEYYRLWRGMEQAANGRDIPLLLAKNFLAGNFDAPIFAALCSKDLNTALERLSQYKPLVGPMALDVGQADDETHLFISCNGFKEVLPRSLGMSEMIFFTQLARTGTRERISPIAVTLPELPEDLIKYEKYFGCDIRQAAIASIRFRAEDCVRPFLADNAEMWNFFDGALSRRLADLGASATTTDRARAVLIESLPAGNSTADFVADKLAMSKRTLQRKLTHENESFQTVLTGVRAELADHYLERSSLSLNEISFLLGFLEPNSFIRAYSTWKGIGPGRYREQLQQKQEPSPAYLQVIAN